MWLPNQQWKQSNRCICESLPFFFLEKSWMLCVGCSTHQTMCAIETLKIMVSSQRNEWWPKWSQCKDLWFSYSTNRRDGMFVLFRRPKCTSKICGKFRKFKEINKRLSTKLFNCIFRRTHSCLQMIFPQRNERCMKLLFFYRITVWLCKNSCRSHRICVDLMQRLFCACSELSGDTKSTQSAIDESMAMQRSVCNIVNRQQ